MGLSGPYRKVFDTMLPDTVLADGDPKGEVKTMWHVKEVVRSIYEHRDQALALELVDRLGHDLQVSYLPVEANQLGPSLRRWKHQICAWHASGVSNGLTETVTNLVKRVKRVDLPAAHNSNGHYI